MAATTKPGRRPARAGAPHGPDEVRASLIAAASELFAASGPEHVSVREIAARAGVNHGLVHHYFGSKDGLLAAVLDAGAAEIASELAHDDGAGVLAPEASGVVRHTRILAHVILASDDPAAIQHEFPTQQLLVTALRRNGLSAAAARERAAQVSALVLGWHLFGEFLTTAVGRPAGARRREAMLRDAVSRLLT